LFPGDREFGQWVAENVLGQLAQVEIEPKGQQAAMWVAHSQLDSADWMERAAAVVRMLASGGVMGGLPTIR
jgi:hypothetical protein